MHAERGGVAERVQDPEAVQPRLATSTHVESAVQNPSATTMATSTAASRWRAAARRPARAEPHAGVAAPQEAPPRARARAAAAAAIRPPGARRRRLVDQSGSSFAAGAVGSERREHRGLSGTNDETVAGLTPARPFRGGVLSLRPGGGGGGVR